MIDTSKPELEQKAKRVIGYCRLTSTVCGNFKRLFKKKKIWILYVLYEKRTTVLQKLDVSASAL